MKNKFLGLLSWKEKLVFFAGLFFERISGSLGFTRLRKFRNIIVGAEMLGFKYNGDNKMLQFEKDNLRISLRKKGSDYDVFEQVFIRDEYHPLISYFIDNEIAVSTIIDAGSNIGLTSLKLKNKFPHAKIICLEPDPNNYQQLKYNMKDHAGTVTLLANALWYIEEQLFIDFQFRDGKDWSRAVSTDKANSEVEVKGISLQMIIDQFKLETIDILKIDIEGSEAKIFDMQNDMSFLRKVKVLAIEIHDEFKCRDTIYDILISNNFKIFNAGELTIGISQNC